MGRLNGIGLGEGLVEAKSGMGEGGRGNVFGFLANCIKYIEMFVFLYRFISWFLFIRQKSYGLHSWVPPQVPRVIVTAAPAWGWGADHETWMSTVVLLCFLPLTIRREGSGSHHRASH